MLQEERRAVKSRRGVVFSSVFMWVVISALIGMPSEAQKQPQPPKNRTVVQEDLDNYVMVLQRAKYGFEKPGVKIELILKGVVGDPIEAWQYLRLTANGKADLLLNISQLRGNVQITSEALALRYARLLTSPQTWYLWKNGTRQMEVLESTELVEVLAPGFGTQGLVLYAENGRDNPYWLYNGDAKIFEWIKRTRQDDYIHLKTAKHPDLSGFGTGWDGILSRKLFRKGGFTPPQVTAVSGGYQITRWLFTEGRSASSLPVVTTVLIQEFVGTDGAYKRNVVRENSTFGFPGIDLRIPTFM